MKKVLALIMIIVIILSCTACGNMNLIDTTWSFEEVYIKMPDGEIVHGKLDSWKDFENSDMIQVRVNGKTYLTHSMNVVMVSN